MDQARPGEQRDQMRVDRRDHALFTQFVEFLGRERVELFFRDREVIGDFDLLLVALLIAVGDGDGLFLEQV